jgi:hypothetical protein
MSFLSEKQIFIIEIEIKFATQKILSIFRVP